MSTNNSLSHLLKTKDPLKAHLLNPIRMSTPVFPDSYSKLDQSSQFEGLMSFKKNPCSFAEKEKILNNFGSPFMPDSPTGSLNFNETLLDDNRSENPLMLPSSFQHQKDSLKDYLILFVDTCKHSPKNQHKNIKLILFDLELNKIAMLYDLSLNSLDFSQEGTPVLPEIQLLDDQIHFCVWSKEHLWVYSLFSKQPICLLYTSPSPRDLSTSRMPSSA